MINVLRRVRVALDILDDQRTTIVTYDVRTCIVTMRQVGNKKVTLDNLSGFLIPLKKTAILTPDDLVDLKNSISTICEEKEPVLISPVLNGYDVYRRGDTYYTSKPKIGFKIRLSSISNRFVLWMMRRNSEEIAMLYRLIGTK